MVLATFLIFRLQQSVSEGNKQRTERGNVPLPAKKIQKISLFSKRARTEVKALASHICSHIVKHFFPIVLSGNQICSLPYIAC